MSTSNKILSLVLVLFFLSMGAISLPAAIYGEHKFLDSFFAIIGFFSAALFACNLYPRHLLAPDAQDSIGDLFAAALTLWLASFLFFILHGTIFLRAVSVVLASAALWWLWKRVSQWFWKSYYSFVGLADIKQIHNWTGSDFDREFAYLRKLFEFATDADQKKRSLDILAFLEVARHYGFVQKREGESFYSLHFVKLEKQDGTNAPSNSRGE